MSQNPLPPGIRPTGPEHSSFVPRHGMYAGPGYCGGHEWKDVERPSAAAWQTQPIGYLDAVTRDHDLNYTYIEQVYGRASPAEQHQAYWQADKEMLANMLQYQPSNWMEATYRKAAIEAFLAKADLNYHPDVNIREEWNRDLAGIDPSYGQMNGFNRDGRPEWSLVKGVHTGATYVNTGMERLSTSGVNSQVAMLFNQHIDPSFIRPHKAENAGDLYSNSSEDNYSHRIMVPERDKSNPKQFHSEGWIDGKYVKLHYDSEYNKLVRSAYSQGELVSETTYKGKKAVGPAGDQYGHADFTVTEQRYVNGEPAGKPIHHPDIKADAVPNIQRSEHTARVETVVSQGKTAPYPDKPTEADMAWSSGRHTRFTRDTAPAFGEGGHSLERWLDRVLNAAEQDQPQRFDALLHEAANAPAGRALQQEAADHADKRAQQAHDPSVTGQHSPLLPEAPTLAHEGPSR